MAGTPPEELSDLPPSAKLVYKVLEYEAPLTQQELIEQSYLPGRTVRYALDQLRGIDVIQEEIHFADARQRVYSLTVSRDAASEESNPRSGDR